LLHCIVFLLKACIVYTLFCSYWMLFESLLYIGSKTFLPSVMLVWSEVRFFFVFVQNSIWPSFKSLADAECQKRDVKNCLMIIKCSLLFVCSKLKFLGIIYTAWWYYNLLFGLCRYVCECIVRSSVVFISSVKSWSLEFRHLAVNQTIPSCLLTFDNNRFILNFL